MKGLIWQFWITPNEFTHLVVCVKANSGTRLVCTELHLKRWFHRAKLVEGDSTYLNTDFYIGGGGHGHAHGVIVYKGEDTFSITLTLHVTVGSEDYNFSVLEREERFPEAVEFNRKKFYDNSQEQLLADQLVKKLEEFGTEVTVLKEGGIQVLHRNDEDQIFEVVISGKEAQKYLDFPDPLDVLLKLAFRAGVVSGRGW